MPSIYNLDLPGGSDKAVTAGGEALYDHPAGRVVNWDALPGDPGSNIRVGFVGRVRSASGTSTMRLRLGGTYAVDGTVIHSFDVTGDQQVFEEVTITKPVGASYLKLTGENAVANTILTGPMVHIIPPTNLRGIMLNRWDFLTSSSAGGVEQLRAQWLVDFDEFGDADELLFGWGGLTEIVFTADYTKRLRIRVGGTFDGIDGDEVISYNEEIFGPSVRGLQNTIAKPTGIQPVKFTLQTDDPFTGFPVNVSHQSLIIRAAIVIPEL